MRLLKHAAIALLVALSGTVSAIGPKPVGSGETTDLPAGVHMRNVGGSDGAGLCVFTSGQHAALWQNVRELDGFRAWMQRRPGGGYPQKFDAMVNQFCKEKGVPVPAYLQHTGGDPEFLERTLKTDRMVCVTYAGVDDFYRGEVIAHMVNLVYLSDTEAAILDNNRPGEMVWMTRKQFLDRWQGLDANGNSLRIGRFAVGGGWAYCFLAPPPPSDPEGVTESLTVSAKPGCSCGNGCACGHDPCRCVMFGQCANGQCNRRPVSVPSAPTASREGWVETTAPGVWQRYENGLFLGQLESDGWHAPTATGVEARATPLPDGIAPPVTATHLTGVEFDRVPKAHKFSKNGREIEREQAWAALAEPQDDTNRWHLSFLGDAAGVAKARSEFAALPQDVRDKLLPQFYLNDSWSVQRFLLSPGWDLRAPSPNGRKSAKVGAGQDLKVLLAVKGAPLYVEPKPDPVKDPAVPVPAPVAPAKGRWVWLVIGGALLLVWIARKRS